MIIEAAQFASKSHLGQTRKYSGVPYIRHPARVAAMVTCSEPTDRFMVAAAWLHDVCEDCDVLPSTIGDMFGNTVKDYVIQLTNPSKTMLGVSRKSRKLADLRHIISCSPVVKFIKLCDIFDNIDELVIDLERGLDIPKDFGKLYSDEKTRMVEAIGGTHPVLSKEILVSIERLRNLCEWDHK